LEQSFAQYQSDRSVVGLARGVARTSEKAAELWARAACHLGDFEHYAGLRADISRLEAEAARSRRADRRAESIGVLGTLSPGDIISLTSGRRADWAVVIDPGIGKEGPKPLVLTDDKQLKRLTAQDFPTPPTVVGRLRVPKHFNPRQPADRRNLHAAFRSKLSTVDLTTATADPAQLDADVAARVADLRREVKAHPCHGCPDREEHARWAEQALRLERDVAGMRAAASKRTNTIATKFDKICGVLEALGYLAAGGDTVTDAGRMLARLYCELDLVAAECVRAGLFDELSAPELAAVLSSLIFESRGGDQRRPARMPNRSTEIAQTALRQVWREVGLLERDHRLDKGRDPDIGFAEPVFAWASGWPLADVLMTSGLTAGDFVRWTRQVIDLVGQVSDAAGPGPLRDTCREAIALMRRRTTEGRAPVGAGGGHTPCAFCCDDATGGGGRGAAAGTRSGLAATSTLNPARSSAETCTAGPPWTAAALAARPRDARVSPAMTWDRGSGCCMRAPRPTRLAARPPTRPSSVADPQRIRTTLSPPAELGPAGSARPTAGATEWPAVRSTPAARRGRR